MQSFGLIVNNFGVSASSVAPDFPFKIVSSLFDTRLICFLVFTQNKRRHQFVIYYFDSDLVMRSIEGHFSKLSDRFSS